MRKCPFCDGDASEPGHRQRCDGRQGRIEFEASEDDYPTMVRNSDPGTSHAAAHSWTPEEMTEVQQRVYALHQAHPEGLTDEQLLRLYQREHLTAESSPRKRRCDLTRYGMIADSGQRRLLVSGRMGIVWMLQQQERKAG